MCSSDLVTGFESYLPPSACPWIPDDRKPSIYVEQERNKVDNENGLIVIEIAWRVFLATRGRGGSPAGPTRIAPRKPASTGRTQPAAPSKPAAPKAAPTQPAPTQPAAPNVPIPTPKHPVPSVPGSPTTSPGPSWTWKGKPGEPVGGEKGAWFNPKTGESLHPDVGHGGKVGPHWDWRDPNGDFWRIFPDGRVEPRS